MKLVIEDDDIGKDCPIDYEIYIQLWDYYIELYGQEPSCDKLTKKQCNEFIQDYYRKLL